MRSMPLILQYNDDALALIMLRSIMSGESQILAPASTIPDYAGNPSIAPNSNPFRNCFSGKCPVPDDLVRGAPRALDASLFGS